MPETTPRRPCRALVLALAALLLLPAVVLAAGMQGGTTIHNYNFFDSITWTYSWSGFFAGEGEI